MPPDKGTDVGLAIVEAIADDLGPVIPPGLARADGVVRVYRANVNCVASNQSRARIGRIEKVGFGNDRCLDPAWYADDRVLYTVSVHELNDHLDRLRGVSGNDRLNPVEMKIGSNARRGCGIEASIVLEADDQVTAVVLSQSDACLCDLGGPLRWRRFDGQSDSLWSKDH
jgi:hypothetical protein